LGDADHCRLRDGLKGANRSRKGPIGVARSHAECLDTDTDPREVQSICVTRMLALKHSRNGFVRPANPKTAVFRHGLTARLIPTPPDWCVASPARWHTHLSGGRNTPYGRRAVIKAWTGFGAPHTGTDCGRAYEHERYDS